MERNPDSEQKGKKMPLHPRLIPYKTVSIKNMMRFAKSRSTYSEADIAGALKLIADLVTEHLRDGDNVEIEGLGFFSVSLQSRPVMEKGELRSESVHFKNVNFRCCQELKKALRTMPLSRLKEPGYKSLVMEEKEERLDNYMDKYPYITVMQYRRLTGTSDYSARKDLAAFVSAGLLLEGGTRHLSIYTRPKEEDTDVPQPLVVDSNL